MELMDVLKAADGGEVIELRCMRSVLNCSISSNSAHFFERGKIYDFTKIGDNYVIGIEGNHGVVPIKEYSLHEEDGHWTNSLEKTLKHFEFAAEIKKESIIVEVVINKGSSFIFQLILERLKKIGQIRKLYSDIFVELFKNSTNEEKHICRERIFFEVNTNHLESFCTSFPDVVRMRLPGDIYASWFKTNTSIELDIDPAELACYSM